MNIAIVTLAIPRAVRLLLPGTRPDLYREMARLGLVGGPLIILSGTLVMFGVDHPGGPLQSITVIPEFVWELLLGIYCTVKGFRPSSPILRADVGGDRREAMPAATPA